MPDVTLTPATLRETSWLAANMRQCDQDEIWCQTYDRNPAQLAHQQLSLSPRIAWVASINDEPVCVYGVAEWQPGLCHLWAWGTPKMYGALRVVTDHIKSELYDTLFQDNRVQRVECRSLATHKAAHRWIKTIGLKEIIDLPCYGKNGETFKLFALTRKDVGYHVLSTATAA